MAVAPTKLTTVRACFGNTIMGELHNRGVTVVPGATSEWARRGAMFLDYGQHQADGHTRLAFHVEVPAHLLATLPDGIPDDGMDAYPHADERNAWRALVADTTGRIVEDINALGVPVSVCYFMSSAAEIGMRDGNTATIAGVTLHLIPAEMADQIPQNPSV